MEELNIVPIYRNGLGEITTGIDIPVPIFCRGRIDNCDKCRNYYLELEKADEGLYTCPYGFNSYVFKIDEDNFIFTCLKVKEQYDKKKLALKTQSDGREYREISYDTLRKYADAYKIYNLSQNQYYEYRQFVEDVLHDIRKFNGDIKAKNKRILQKAETKAKFAEFLKLSRSITEMGWFMTLRLNNHDFMYNESLMCTDALAEYNMFRIFDKVNKCLSENSDNKFLSVKLKSDGECSNILAHESIELLAYILLDNAIKYAPENTEIEVKFKEKQGKQTVVIKSLGPYCPPEELGKIVLQGYRGKNAQSMARGNGIGLFTAKKICEVNTIKISFFSDDNIEKRSSGVEYTFFSVELIKDL